MQNEESVQNLDSGHLTAAAIDQDKGNSKASSGTRRKSPIPDSNLGAPSSSMNNSQADATAIAIADSAGVFPLSPINEDQVQSWAGALVDGTAISWIFEALQSSFGGKGQTLTLTPARSWQSSEHLTRNEVLLHSCVSRKCWMLGRGPFPLQLHVTSHRLILQSVTEMKQFVSIWRGQLLSVTKVGGKVKSKSLGSQYSLFVETKNFVQLHVDLDPATGDRQILYRLLASFKPSDLLTRGSGSLAAQDGCPLSSLLATHLQQQVTEGWRSTGVNKDYSVCSTYPSVCLVPAICTDEIIESASQYRSRGRFPAAEWIDKSTGAALFRASQPKAGLKQARSSADEEVLRASLACSKGDRLVILDARPKVNAVANRAKGFGYESTQHYPFAELEFCDIGNIHVMRESVKAVSRCAGQAWTPGGRQGKYGVTGIEHTGWMSHIHLVLKAAFNAYRHIAEQHRPVLVHCSDGWDRTSQIVSLAQILLDPYYRTLEGFLVLVQKSWISFGHRFRTRCNHLAVNSNDVETAPIFLQYLDCVFQMVVQQPGCFEFTPSFLKFIANSLYDCRHRNFLFDCERERQGSAVTLPSLFHDAVNNDSFRNENFQSVNHLPTVDFSQSGLKFWHQFYLQYVMYPLEQIAGNTRAMLSPPMPHAVPLFERTTIAGILSPGSRSLPRQQMIVSVMTAPKMSEFSTTATFFLVIEGLNGASREIQLFDPAERQEQAKGADSYDLIIEDVGEIVTVWIGADFKTEAASCEITNVMLQSRKRTYVCKEKTQLSVEQRWAPLVPDS